MLHGLKITFNSPAKNKPLMLVQFNVFIVRNKCRLKEANQHSGTFMQISDDLVRLSTSSLTIL